MDAACSCLKRKKFAMGEEGDGRWMKRASKRDKGGGGGEEGHKRDNHRNLEVPKFLHVTF